MQFSLLQMSFLVDQEELVEIMKARDRLRDVADHQSEHQVDTISLY